MTKQNSDTTFGWLVSSPPLPQGKTREAALRAGRDAVRLMQKRDGAAFFAKFTPDEARSMSGETLQKIVNGLELTKEMPALELVSGSLTAPIYYAVCPQQNRTWQQGIAVTFAFARADSIAGLRLETQIKPAHQASTIKLGRAVCLVIAKNNVNGLYALLSPASQRLPYQQIPKDKLADYLARAVTTEKPIGRRIGEAVAPASVEDDGSLMYVAEFAQGSNETRKIVLVFTSDQKKVAAFYLIDGLDRAKIGNKKGLTD